MTAQYARLSDKTVREHWEKARKVDAEGQPVQIRPDGPLGDAGWAKQQLSGATTSTRRTLFRPWPSAAHLADKTQHAYQSGRNLRVVRYVRGRDRPRHTAKAFLRRAHGRALPAGPGPRNPLPPTAEPDLPTQPSSHSLVWVWVRPRNS
jgi:hypothetical protein